MYLSYPNIFIRFSIITLCHRSFKEGLEKRVENQDNVISEKSAEDHCGDHGQADRCYRSSGWKFPRK